jgi:hypothetical protein
LKLTKKDNTRTGKKLCRRGDQNIKEKSTKKKNRRKLCLSIRQCSPSVTSVSLEDRFTVSLSFLINCLSVKLSVCPCRASISVSLSSTYVTYENACHIPEEKATRLSASDFVHVTAEGSWRMGGGRPYVEMGTISHSDLENRTYKTRPRFDSFPFFALSLLLSFCHRLVMISNPVFLLLAASLLGHAPADKLQARGEESGARVVATRLRHFFSLQGQQPASAK